jgi:hypothetical protein
MLSTGLHFASESTAPPGARHRTGWTRGDTAGLPRPSLCSTFVLMQVETQGVDRSLGWKVHMRCANGYREETRSIRKCVYRKQLDLDTLVCTRGPNFSISRLEARLLDPGPHQFKRYRCAATRLRVYGINENINCLSFELFIFSVGTDTNMVSLCESLHW